MYTVNFGKSSLKYFERPYGFEIRKYRRNSEGKFAPAEKSYILDQEKVSEININLHQVRLLGDLGLL